MADSIALTAAGGCLFAGGGTAGHLFPAIAVAQGLRRRDGRTPVLFVGSDRAPERELVAAAGFEHVGLSLLPRRDLWRRPWAVAYRFWQAYRTARRLLKERRPRVVIGCGGLASVPTVWAARRIGIPIVLLEQNVLPGRATRRLARWANVVCTTFEETRSWLPSRTPVVVTGNPVRDEIARLADRPPQAAVPPLLLILGGTLGAQAINTSVLAGVAADVDAWRSWQIVHQTGRDDFDRVRQRYAELGLPARVAAFLDDVPALLVSASIVVSRAGATTLAELACAARPAVVAPWTGAADDHQTLNARWYAERGAVEWASDGHGQSPLPGAPAPLWECVLRLRDDPALRVRRAAACRAVARPQATDAVLAVIEATASR